MKLLRPLILSFISLCVFAPCAFAQNFPIKIIKDVVVQGGKYVSVGSAGSLFVLKTPAKKHTSFKDLFHNKPAAPSPEMLALKTKIESTANQIFHFETAEQLAQVFEQPIAIASGERWKLRLKEDCSLGKKGEIFVIKRGGKERILKELRIINAANKIDFSQERKVVDFDLIKAHGVIEDAALKEYMNGSGFNSTDVYAESISLLTKGVKTTGVIAAEVVWLNPAGNYNRLASFYYLQNFPLNFAEMNALENIFIKLEKAGIAHKDIIGGGNFGVEDVGGRVRAWLIDFSAAKYPNNGDMQDLKDFARFKENCEKYGIYVP